MSDDENVVPFNRKALKIVDNGDSEAHPDDILDAARGHMQDVIVIGWKKDDGMLWFGSSPLTFGEILELLENAKDVVKHVRSERFE